MSQRPSPTSRTRPRMPEGRETSLLQPTINPKGKPRPSRSPNQGGAAATVASRTRSGSSVSSRSRSLGGQETVPNAWTATLEQCPYRRVDWRWEQARLLFEDSINPSKRKHDPGVRLANAFQAALRRCHRRGDDLKLALRMPEAHGAWSLQNGNPHQRWEVEARLLARQSDDEIAEKLLLDAAIVATFASLFFDVRNHLGNKSYIARETIKLHPMPKEPDLGLYWKFMAYHGGPDILDAVLVDNLEPARPGNRAEAGRYLAEQTFNVALAKVMFAAWMVPVSGRDALRFLRIYRKFEDSERCRLRRSGRTTPTTPIVVATTTAMMEGIRHLLPFSGEQPTGSNSTGARDRESHEPL
jgi:hypothetical protein